TNDFAHRALCSAADHVLRVAHVEQVLDGIGHAPLNREPDINDVLVARQHKSFALGIAVGSRANAGLTELGGNAFDVFDRPPMEVETRLAEVGLRLAELQFDADFAFVDGVDGIEQPENDQRANAANDRPASAGKIGTALKAVATAAQKVLETGAAAFART